MKTLLRTVLLTLSAAAPGTVKAQPAEQQELPEEYSCVACHTKDGAFYNEGNPIVTPADLAGDIHWQKGLRCHDCHGGDPKLENFVDHRDDPGFHFVETPGDIPGFCGRCHSDGEYMGRYEEAPKTNIVEEYWKSGHGLALKAGPSAEETKLATCIECHGTHEIRSAADPKSPCHPTRVAALCASCHQDQTDAMLLGAHADSTPMACGACHGEDPHRLIAFSDRRTAATQVQTCGGCHEDALDEYEQSVHGHGLWQSGLLKTALCADCHGAHTIYPASEEQSPLNPTNVAATCGKCHRFIEERVRKSVHGTGNGPGGATKEAARGGEIKRTASCTDCHPKHGPHPKSEAFRLALPGQCGACHKDLERRYRMSLHGALTELGHAPAAKCSDCHGAHDILPIRDPRSLLAPGENRLKTCRGCHPHATANFCNFDPHADRNDPQQYPVLHAVYLGMEILICSVFAFFGVHSLLWFVRSLAHVLRHGRPRRLVAEQPAYVRFEPIHRVVHVIVIVSFLGLALTGLPLRYSDQAWAQVLARALGGFGSTAVWHHICGIVTIFYFVTHLTWVTRKLIERRMQGDKWRSLVLGPDSPVPNARDFVDFSRMVRWFFGRGPKPVFERWTYWEKFDYWAVFWGVGIIGTSGLILWFPNLFSTILPGEILNVAKIVHSEEALLATSFIFAIHFFGTHFRPEKFPMDLSVLTGLVTEEELREERPEFLKRMRREGKLDALRTSTPSRRTLRLIALGGSVALAVGLALLVGILLAILTGTT